MAGWPASSWPRTCGCTAPWRSSCWRWASTRRWTRTPVAGSSEKPVLRPRSPIHMPCRSSTPAMPTVSLYLVMELVDGSSLATLLARDGPLGIDRSRDLVDQVLQALGAAHRAGIVHRDVKPGNVLVTADGVAKLSDFGIAKRLDDLGGDLTMPGHVVGTPSSMAPEQVTGRPATPATDVYAAGVLLYQVLANAPPFDAGSSIATALAQRDAPVPDVRERRADVPGRDRRGHPHGDGQGPGGSFRLGRRDARARWPGRAVRSPPARRPGSSGAPDDRTRWRPRCCRRWAAPRRPGRGGGGGPSVAPWRRRRRRVRPRPWRRSPRAGGGNLGARGDAAPVTDRRRLRRRSRP